MTSKYDSQDADEYLIKVDQVLSCVRWETEKE